MPARWVAVAVAVAMTTAVAVVKTVPLGPRPEFAINHVTALAITEPLGGSVHKSLSRFGLLAEGFNGLRLQSIG